MGPIAMVNVAPAHRRAIVSPPATKRKAEDTTEHKPGKRQKAVSSQATPQKTPTSPKTTKPSAAAHKSTANPLSKTAATIPKSAQAQAPAVDSASRSQTLRIPRPTCFHLPYITLPLASFNKAVPALITPWPHNFPAPTRRFPHSLSSCPIDWSSITGLKQDQIEAYELRAPWNPSPLTFEAVAQQAQRIKGKIPSAECVRKRFKKASLAVFQHSGVYFETTALGLEPYGIPKQRHLNELIDAALKTTSYITTTSSIPKQLPKTRPTHHETAIYTGELVAITLQPAHTTSHPTIRLCAKSLIHNPSLLNTYHLSITDNEITIHQRPPTLPFSPAAFDFWHAEVAEGRYMLRDGGVRGVTGQVMLETYCLARWMGSVEVAGMVGDEVVRWMNSGEFPGFESAEVEGLERWVGAGDALVGVVRGFLERGVGG
ncbi:hypothetical protein EKO04_006669 [Ascochyta lentis]|uniref:Uncharacterized protein n=1 Tax=Ascochyta lentis TaxID=205686 RepID=A0A8H7J4W5_9PLEO|nr:hypothetical protein EKO04_006669 [Ascochyta lentis]